MSMKLSPGQKIGVAVAVAATIGFAYLCSRNNEQKPKLADKDHIALRQGDMHPDVVARLAKDRSINPRTLEKKA